MQTEGSSSKSAEKQPITSKTVELQNIKTKMHSSNAATNWIWSYWEEVTKEIKGTPCQVIICKVAENLDASPCGKTYIKGGGSTGNAINHLRNKHNITKNGKEDKKQQKLDGIIQPYTRSEKRQQQLQLLADWIIADPLPFNIVNSKNFREFVYQLDPGFVMPCQETIKSIIYKTYW
ncbi:7007_t:CDS:2, partial [Ambispora leptoticha]